MKRELYKAVKKNKYADKKKDFFVVVVLTVSEYGRGSYKNHELYSCVLRLKMLLNSDQTLPICLILSFASV